MQADYDWIGELPLEHTLSLREALSEYLSTDQLQDYRPYLKQKLFHAAGLGFPHRMLRAGNQNGKSMSAGAEMAMHLTGEYESDWDGLRFNHPITAWACGATALATVQNPQRILLGEPGRYGSGMIPKRCLTHRRALSKAVKDLYDYVRVRHISGGTSIIWFKYYAQAVLNWMGPPVHFVWLDEEPPWDHYHEAMARLIGVNGKSVITFTPKKGRSRVVMLYLDPVQAGKSRHNVRMTIHDAKHIAPADAQRRIDECPEYMRDAVIFGIPAAGEGAVYPIEDSQIMMEPFEIPAWWPMIAGLDFGWKHPTAGVILALDPDNDIVYVTREYRQSEKAPQFHYMVLRKWGDDLEWAWPKDGENHQPDGDQEAEIYRNEGLNMLPEHAQFVPVSDRGVAQSVVSVNRGILEILQRMQTGRWKVFNTCIDWMEEKRQYARVKGQIVKEEDDLLDASRYAYMMLRYARPVQRRGSEIRGRGMTSYRLSTPWNAM